ncbi:MAG: aminotransferase class III-fold pyridoxal phosphate-dependent enzyme, partial [Chloroflexota bacterium]|nr:aminotransferase class III-fold pyridoxal phosphate-dependent enzyme [Chloroflexota bacterium]
MTIKKGMPGPQARAWVERDAAAIAPCYTRSYPFVMDHGRGSEVWDVDGNRFIDCSAGIAVTATGHAHPKVVKAIQEQAEKFI